MAEEAASMGVGVGFMVVVDFTAEVEGFTGVVEDFTGVVEDFTEVEEDSAAEPA